jgi:1-acyl-sn-glycerol-3-phosphate acyltransferase
MNRAWYRLCHWACARLYFDRITVRHRERLPAQGPVLYLGTHRNGAVDGFTYRQVAPRGEFLISTQLLRSPLARLFFHGIPVTRDKDQGERHQAGAALDRCRELLAAGGALFVFPEGTSSLGPRHLPFKSGAARIALDCLSRGQPLTVVPIGVHYERAWAFRSRVEFVVGPPIATELDPSADPVQQLHTLRRRFTAALEAVGANFTTSADQELSEMFAYAATLGTDHSYSRSLQLLAAGVPEPLRALWQKLELELSVRKVWRHQRVPLFPQGPLSAYLLGLALLTPIVAAGAVINLPPLLAGGFAARRFADDRNVIALWRILVGLPVFALWFTAVSATFAALAGWPWALGYALLTMAALKVWSRTRKLAVAVGNAVRHPDLAPRAHEFHAALLLTISRLAAAAAADNILELPRRAASQHQPASK